MSSSEPTDLDGRTSEHDAPATATTGATRERRPKRRAQGPIPPLTIRSEPDVPGAARDGAAGRGDAGGSPDRAPGDPDVRDATPTSRESSAGATTPREEPKKRKNKKPKGKDAKPDKSARKAAEKAAKQEAKKAAKQQGKGTGKKRRKPARTAATSDRHELYQLSVQAPEVDAPFFAKFHRRYVGRPARVLREDFCGTAFLAAHWVKLHEDNRAVGVDLDGPTLAWGRRRNIDTLDADQRGRLELIQDDVRVVRTIPCDVLVALNFSYSFFTTRDALRGYLAHARQDIVRGGLMFLDAWGGSETQVEQEEERDVEDFTYVWEQKRFDPISHQSECRIHFRFKDGSEMRNAFRYRWRQWSLPELAELMTEAGFEDVHVLWEGTDKKTGEGNEQYRRAERGEADPAWIAYVVGRA